MLRVSKLADYATVVMVYLARHSEEFHNAKSIASDCHIGAPTVSKVLKLLAAADLLSSARGSQGGYALARPASLISVAGIIAAIDGQTGLTECSDAAGLCALQGVCMISGNWQLISRAIVSALDSVSLEQLAAPTMHQSVVDTRDITRLRKE